MTSPLVDVATLASWLVRDDVRIVDCRFDLADTEAGRRAHHHAHIPGAVYAHLDEDLSAPEGPGRHPLPAPETFAERLAEFGIGNTSTVVAYDASGGAYAARLWWMLRALGHVAVSVLDGGWQAWQAAGFPEESGEVGATHTPFTAPATWRGTIDRNGVRDALGHITLVDARAPERYRGEAEPLDPVAGHIPTAVNLPFVGNLDGDGRFLVSTDLAVRYSDLGDDVVAYCGSGVTACHTVLAMELAGLTDVRLYPGSWSDWGTAGGEVAVGSEPGTPTR